jgi:hypothetical protein
VLENTEGKSKIDNSEKLATKKNKAKTIFQLYRSGQFYWWWKLDHPDTDKLFDIMLYRIHLAISWVQTHNVSAQLAVNLITIRSRARGP